MPEKEGKTTRRRVLEILWNADGQYVSGQTLAGELALSRTAVWKAIEQLRTEGYDIASVPNRGYRLTDRDEVLSEVAVRGYLRHTELDLRVRQTITSTNTVLKQMAEEGAPEGTVLVAGEQTAGRGRMGRHFYSPSKSGVYLSILLRPSFGMNDSGKLTVCAAVAVAKSIEKLFGVPAQIKWVNDVFVENRKVCGILTEGAVDCETGMLSYAVVGIGINIDHPESGFPDEITEVAGTIREKSRATVLTIRRPQSGPNGTPERGWSAKGGAAAGNGRDVPSVEPPDMRSRLAAAVLDELMDLYGQLPEGSFYEDYKSRSFLLGRPVTVHTWGTDTVREAVAEDLTPEFALVVRYPDGMRETLNSGEVSVRKV